MFKINLITKTYNNENILPYFFRHYDQFVTNYYIWNNESTDKTLEILKSNFRVKIFNNPDKEFDDYKHRDFKNNAWKEFKDCDFIINCDIDEFLYHQNILEFLIIEENWGAEIFPTEGYQMFNYDLPISEKQIYEEINKGIRDNNYDKPIMFNPKVEPKFSFGAHHLENNGFIWGYPGIKLLHYKFIGENSINDLLKRNNRLSEINKKEGLSLWPEEKGHRFNPHEYWEYLSLNSKIIL